MTMSFVFLMFQDTPAPVMSLCDLCLSHVCRSLDQLCDSRADGSLRLRRAPTLPTETADQLLHRMAVEGRRKHNGSISKCNSGENGTQGLCFGMSTHQISPSDRFVVDNRV